MEEVKVLRPLRVLQEDEGDVQAFIRLSPTVLFKAPKCYGNWQDVTQCHLCPTGKACSVKQELEYRRVK